MVVSALVLSGAAVSLRAEPARQRVVAARSAGAPTVKDLGRDAIANLRKTYRRPAAVPFPDDNPYSDSKARLGQTLFFDPRLSGSNWISCASCHNPGFCWSDGLPRAVGHGMQTLGRRTPTTMNLSWAPALFWDGRAETLEQQALGPVQAPGEMNQSLNALVAELARIDGYKPLFQAAFGDAAVSGTRIGQAIATFERTLVSREAPFDRWITGDESAMSPAARRGFAVFNGAGQCAKCHSGWRFTDDSFHDIGVASTDKGRGSLLPDIESMQYAFKTPTLRNIVERAPYMHDGSASSLAAVVEFYDRGGDQRRPSIASEVHPLHLTAGDKADLVEFMRALTSTDTPVAVPVLPR